MRVLFFGTPAFAVPTLDALLAIDGIHVAGVVTQPDRVQARSHSTMVAPPVKLRALEAGIPVWQPDRPRGEEFLAAMRDTAPDLGVVVAYGHLLRPDLLTIPRLGMVNVHASLLPRWRGAAPIQWALLAGDTETGVSIMRVEAGLDTGAVWHQQRTAITSEDTVRTVTERLALLGADAMRTTLPLIAAGDTPTPQDDTAATHAPKVDRELARIRWDDDAAAVAARIRAMDPFPGAWSTLDGVDVKLFRPIATRVEGGPPGTLLDSRPALRISCGSGVVEIAEVQPSGKRRMPAAEWLRGKAVGAGARFT